MTTPTSGQIRLDQIGDEACEGGQIQFGLASIDSLRTNGPSNNTTREFSDFYNRRGKDTVSLGTGTYNVLATNGFGQAGIRFLENGDVQEQQNSGTWTDSGFNWRGVGGNSGTNYLISYTKVAGGNWTSAPASGVDISVTRTYTATSNIGVGALYDITVESEWRDCDSVTRRFAIAYTSPQS